MGSTWKLGKERLKMVLDRFGKLLRDIRITRSLLLYDMAKDLGMTSAELSGIECGRKPIPTDFIFKLQTHYDIGKSCQSMLELFAKEREAQT